jgi:sugar phosphate isomerase/epimerase
MYFTGFADEAAEGIEGQIKATKELGWEYIEARNIDGVNIHNLPEDKFNTVCMKLKESGIKVNCFGSTIANWGRSIEEPFDTCLAEAKRTIPRMQKLGTRMIRIMSFAVLKDRSPEDQMEEERFRRLRILCQMFQDAGITPLHENCMNYGGMGWTYTLRLIENVPGLKLVFDTGNPVGSIDHTKPKPHPRQSTWEFYCNVKEHVEYVHVKDAKWDDADQELVYTFPGEGDGDVRRILKDLLMNGYDGGISIEPHLSVVFHDASVTASDDSRYTSYVEYGRCLEKMIAAIKAE